MARPYGAKEECRMQNSECGAHRHFSSFFSPNCLPWVRNYALAMIGWRANEERSPVRRAGCLRGARPQGRCRKEECRMQNEVPGAAHGHRGVQAGSRNIAECRIKRRSPRKPQRGVCPLSWQSNGEIFAYVRLCSPMFAFLGKKCLRALREGKSRMIRAHPTKSDLIKPNPMDNKH